MKFKVQVSSNISLSCYIKCAKVSARTYICYVRPSR